MEGFSEIHAIYQTACTWSGGHGGGFYNQKSYLSPQIEFVCNQTLWMEDGIPFADIILPVAGSYETDDIDVTEESDSCDGLYLQRAVVRPIGESKCDRDCILEIAKKLDFYDEAYMGKSFEDRIKGGYDTSGVEELVSWGDMEKNQFYVVEMDPEWYNERSAIELFYEDPKANPISGTPSGKLEFVSGILMDNFPDDKERPPLTKYVRGGGPSTDPVFGSPDAKWSHDETLDSERAKTYTMLASVHVKDWGEHSMHNDIPWLREFYKIENDDYWYEPLWIHPVDAEKRGIKQGDVVKVWNERGMALLGAFVTYRVHPGFMFAMQGGSADYIIPAELSRGGNMTGITPINTISYSAHGTALYGFLAEVAKVTGEDWEYWKTNYPDAFERPYDKACGEVFEGWLEGGKL